MLWQYARFHTELFFVFALYLSNPQDSSSNLVCTPLFLHFSFLATAILFQAPGIVDILYHHLVDLGGGDRGGLQGAQTRDQAVCQGPTEVFRLVQ